MDDNPIPKEQNAILHALYQQMLEKATRLGAENIELKNRIATLSRQLTDAKESKKWKSQFTSCIN